MKETRVKLDIDNRTIIRIALLIAGIWLTIQLVYQIRQPLFMLLLSFLLAIALNKPVNYIASRITRGKGGRGLATGIAYLGVISILGIFLYLTLPPLYDETRQFINTIPETVKSLSDSSNGGVIADFIEEYDLQDEADQFVSNATAKLGDVAVPVVSGAGKLASGVVGVLTVLVLTFFMLVEGPTWAKRFWSFTPKDRLKHNQKLASQMQNVVNGYVNGQLLVALLAGVSSLIMMLIVGLPNPIALAGLVGLFALIPMIGATLGSIVVILVALITDSATAAIVMLVFFIVYQQIENNTIQPYVQSKALNMSPLLILAAVIFGFALGGVLGGFVAIPIVAAAQIVIVDYLEQRQKELDSAS